jgi:hypothetical protein
MAARAALPPASRIDRRNVKFPIEGFPQATQMPGIANFWNR